MSTSEKHLTAEQQKLKELQEQQRMLNEQLKNAREAAEKALSPEEKQSRLARKWVNKALTALMKNDFIEAATFLKNAQKEVDEGRKIIAPAPQAPSQDQKHTK